MKKRFFTNHSKSSAMLVSLAVHCILAIVALSLVVANAVRTEEAVFVPELVKRPKMPPRKLRVPVDVEKQRNKPKLRKTIVVKPRNTEVPDIQIPEIRGVQGGLGTVAGDGVGGLSSLGFSMPKIKILGVKSSGDKIFIILSSAPEIMYDEIGGIPAYQTIKDELVKILGSLDPTALFNIAVYDNSSFYVLFPKLTPATSDNVAKVAAWLKPLNAVSAGMGDTDYGTRTLGPGGRRVSDKLAMEPLKRTPLWVGPTMLAMKQQADSIFVLTQGWGSLYHIEAPATKTWSESKRARYNEIKQKAKEKLQEENEQRRKNGQPPRVLVGYALINTYFPGTQHPPSPKAHWYIPKEIAEAFENQRKESLSKLPPHIKMAKKGRDRYSVNVIHFIPKNTSKKDQKFQKLTNLVDGDYRTLSGLDAIQSSASDSE